MARDCIWGSFWVEMYNQNDVHEVELDILYTKDNWFKSKDSVEDSRKGI